MSSSPAAIAPMRLSSSFSLSSSAPDNLRSRASFISCSFAARILFCCALIACAAASSARFFCAVVAVRKMSSATRASAPIARIKNVYRFHLILKGASRKTLNEALRIDLEQSPVINIVSEDHLRPGETVSAGQAIDYALAHSLERASVVSEKRLLAAAGSE